MHVLTRLEGADLYVMKVAEVDDSFALVEGNVYRLLGHVTRHVSVRDGYTVHEWFAVSEGDIYHVRAGTRKGAIAELLRRYNMEAVRDVDTIPALF